MVIYLHVRGLNFIRPLCNVDLIDVWFREYNHLLIRLIIFQSFLARKLFINSYVPHERAVDGTLMHILGPTPLVNAYNPSF